MQFHHRLWCILLLLLLRARPIILTDEPPGIEADATTAIHTNARPKGPPIFAGAVKNAPKFENVTEPAIFLELTEPPMNEMEKFVRQNFTRVKSCYYCDYKCTHPMQLQNCHRAYANQQRRSLVCLALEFRGVVIKKCANYYEAQKTCARTCAHFNCRICFTERCNKEGGADRFKSHYYLLLTVVIFVVVINYS